jgi:hypothetical protein
MVIRGSGIRELAFAAPPSHNGSQSHSGSEIVFSDPMPQPDAAARVVAFYTRDEKRMQSVNPPSRCGVGFALRRLLTIVTLLVAALLPQDGPASAQTPVGASGAGCPTTIGFGQTITCAITAVDEIHGFSFTASAGDQVLLRITRTSGTLRPRMTVQQAGQYLCGNFALTTTTAICAIRASGSYTLLIDDTFRTETGSYFLHLQRFNAPVGAQPLTAGQPLGGAIGLPAEVDVWSFAAQAGDVALLRASRSTGVLEPRIEIYDQAGRYLCGNYDTETPETTCSFATDGTYSLFVDDTFRINTGGYYVYFQRFNAPGNASPLTAGQTISGAISVPAESDTWSFTTNGTERRLLRVTRTNGTLEPRFTVVDTQGNYICGSYDTDVAETICVLLAAGTYTLLINDTFRVRTGEYSFVFDCPSSGCVPECPPQGCGPTPVLDKQIFVPLIRK